jgi:hypothetical protein
VAVTGAEVAAIELAGGAPELPGPASHAVRSASAARQPAP